MTPVTGIDAVCNTKLSMTKKSSYSSEVVKI
jgi:hypothetical protein